MAEEAKRNLKDFNPFDAATLANTNNKLSMGGAAVGTVAASVSATKAEKAFLEDMVEEYRPEIAERLGKAAEQVTKEEFDLAFAEIPALAQAKEKVSRSQGERLLTGLLSSVAGFLSGIGAGALTRRVQPGEQQENADNIASSLSSGLGALAVGKLVGGLFNRGGYEKKLQGTAHARIMEIKDKQLSGEETTPMDVFQVKLDLMPGMQQAIEAEVGKSFAALSEQEQAQLMQTAFPPNVWMGSVEIARNINAGARPQGLLFDEFKRVIPPAALRPEMPEQPQPEQTPDVVPEQVPPQVMEALEAQQKVAQVEAAEQNEVDAPQAEQMAETAPAAKPYGPHVSEILSQQTQNAETAEVEGEEAEKLPEPPQSHAERVKEMRKQEAEQDMQVGG